MPDSPAERARRSRAHKAGDHSSCTGRCAVVRAAGDPTQNGVPASDGPVASTVTAYVESLHLDGGDARTVMASCALRLAQAFDSAPGREIPSLSRELRLSLQWLSEAGDAGDKLDEIRSRRLLRLTDSVLARAASQPPWPGDDDDLGA
jgi:hypothetical protein